MATTSATSASSLNLQMEDVADKLFTHINRESPEFNILNLVSRALDGKYYRVDFQDSGNAYMASRPIEQGSGVYTPGYDPSTSANDQIAGFTTGEMLFRARRHYMSTDFTGAMKSAVKSRKGGYMNLQEFRFKDTLEFMKEQMGIKIATSQVGTRARVKTTCTSTTLYVEYPGVSGAALTFEAGARYLRPGMVIDCTTAGRQSALNTATDDRGRRITAVALDTGTSAAGVAVTLAAAPTSWASGGYVVMYGERQAAAITSTTIRTGCYGLLGLIDAVDDGNTISDYGELVRSSYPTLQALVFSAASAGTLEYLTPQKINYAIERKNQISGGKVNVAYGTFGVIRNLADSLTITGAGGGGGTASNNPLRFEAGKSTQTMGVNKIKVMPLGMDGELELMPSRLAPHHTLFLLDRESMILLQDGPPRYINEDGLTIRKTTGKDEFTADWVWPATGIVCREPWKNIRLDDLKGDHMTP